MGRLLILMLFFGCCLFGCGSSEPSYQVSCEQVVCEDADLEKTDGAYKRCSWCVSSLEARVVTFREMDGCWGIDREFDWAEGQCIMFNRF